MPLHSLDLTLDAGDEEWVRREWQALADADLPSQAHHRSPTNAPHVTLASAPVIMAEHERTAVQAVAPLLPISLGLAGVVLLGRGPYAVARLLTAGRDLQDVANAVRDAVGDPHSRGWTPHLTLARRVPVDQVSDVLAAIATGPAAPHDVTVTALRRWDPDASIVRWLTDPQP